MQCAYGKICVGMGMGVGDKLGVGRGVGGVGDKMWAGMGSFGDKKEASSEELA